MSTCYKCNRENVKAGQRLEIDDPIPVKANGWVGDTFVPLDRRFKATVRTRRPVLCGMCYANECMEREREGGNDVQELQQALLELAEKEIVGVAAPATNGTNGHKPERTVTAKVSKNGRGRKRARRPKMTAEQAKSFDRMSAPNYMLVKAALNGTCDCDPYTDVFTFRRWLAQNNPVRKGQHAICKTPIIKHVVKDDAETGETTERRVMGNSVLFCRCQTQEAK